MEFMENLKETLNEDFNEKRTENGALGYRTTGSEIVDFNYKIASYRGASEDEIIQDFTKVWLDNKVLAMKFLFFIRDREEGLGERRLFRILIKHLAVVETDMVKKVLPIIAEYGRFDDMLELFDTPLEEYVIMEVLGEQILEDVKNYKEGKPISLLAKWLPSINASSKLQRKRAKKIIKYSEFSKKEYRKLLSMLREHIDVVERKMCAEEWDKIKYENVPSRANLIYNEAFYKHDKERREEYLESVKKGEKKINSSKLYPHDIVHKYTIGRRYINCSVNDTFEELWKALPVKDIENTIVVADGSSSMLDSVGNTDVTALDVANALAIYFAEHNKGEFKDKYITFSGHPEYVDFKDCTSLRDKIIQALIHNEVANTNIKAVFDLILQTGINHNISQEDMPKNILIISDMEFDECVTTEDNEGVWWSSVSKEKIPNQKLFHTISKQYEEAGYKLPRIIFWNVNSRTKTIPVRQNELGVALVSGFSTNIADMVMSCKLDPLEVILEKLNTERYKKVEEILALPIDKC